MATGNLALAISQVRLHGDYERRAYWSPEGMHGRRTTVFGSVKTYSGYCTVYSVPDHSGMIEGPQHLILQLSFHGRIRFDKSNFIKNLSNQNIRFSRNRSEVGVDLGVLDVSSKNTNSQRQSIAQVCLTGYLSASVSFPIH
jgi:hypothetical protein